MRSIIFFEVVTFLLIVLFFYTGVSKLVDHGTFVAHIEQSLVLQRMSGPLAIGVPVLEILTAIALAIPRFRTGGLYVSVFLLFIFSVYIILILGISAKLPCACGGVVSWMGVEGAPAVQRRLSATCRGRRMDT